MSSITPYELYKKIQPYIVDLIANVSTAGTNAASGALTAHALDGAYHTGTLARAQAPWVASDISSAVSIHASDPDAHHVRLHDILSTGDHTITGAAFSLVGATATDTLGLLTPSSAPGATEKILKSSSAGNLTLPTLTATSALTAPLITTSSGALTIAPDSELTAIAGDLSVSDTATVVTSLSVPSIITDSGALSIAPAGAVTSVTGALTASTKVQTPLIDTASGNLTIAPTGGTVSVTGTLSASTKLRAPLIDTASGGLTISPANAATNVTGTLSASTKLRTPLIDTASGGLTIAPAGAVTAVTGALTASNKVQTPLIDTATGDLTIAPTGGDTAITGNVAVSALLTAGANADGVHVLGRAKLGSVAGSDVASFAHYDYTGTDFALAQYNNGSTRVNAVAGSAVYVSVGGVDTLTVNSQRLLPKSSLQIDMGDYNRKFRAGFFGEIVAEILTAQEVYSTVGGVVDVAPTTKLIADISSTDGVNELFTNLVSYWSLSDTADAHGSNTLTDTNLVPYAAGKVGNAAYFLKSASQYLSVADNADLSAGDVDIAWSGWIYPTLNDGSIMCVASKGTNAAMAWAVQINWATSKIYFDAYDSGGSLTYVGSDDFGTLTTNTWYHVVAWHDATADEIGIAVNGTATTTAHTGGVRDDSGGLVLGAYSSDSPSRYYQGRIDEAAWWKNYVPDSTDRTWLYNSGSGRSYADLVAYAYSTEINFDVEHNSFASGTYMYMSGLSGAGLPQFEVFKLTSSASTITGGYRYTALRAIDGTPPNDWLAGDGVKSLGNSVGDGYINLTATESLFGSYGPTITTYVRNSTATWDAMTAVTAMGNLRSFVDYVSDTQGFAAGNDLTLTPTSGFKGITVDPDNGLRLFSVDLSSYNSTLQTVDLSAGGSLKLGTNVADVETTTFSFLASNGETRIGALATNKPNILFDSSGNLNIRNYNTPVITLGADGTSYFSGAMTLGTDGGIYQGSGTFASPTTGLKLYRNGTQGEVALYHSGSKVTWLNGDSGVNMAANTTLASLDKRRALNFYNGSELIGQLTSYTDATYGEGVYLASTEDGTGTGKRRMEIAAFSPDNTGTVIVSAFGNAAAQTANIRLEATASASSIAISADEVTISGQFGTDWTGLSFGTGWSNYGGSWNSGSYKRVGDLVFLRGMVKRTSGTGTLIATLPVGYRPSGHQRIVRSTAGGYVEIDVQRDGTIDLTSGTYSMFVSLSSIVFSTI